MQRRPPQLQRRFLGAGGDGGHRSGVAAALGQAVYADRNTTQWPGNYPLTSPKMLWEQVPGVGGGERREERRSRGCVGILFQYPK